MKSVVLALSFLATAANADVVGNFDVAEACVELAGHVDRVAEIVALASDQRPDGEQQMLSKTIHDGVVVKRLYQIVAGPVGREFAFVEMDGVTGIERLAKACIDRKSCDDEVLSVVVGFGTFLIDACRQDFEGDGL